MRLTHLERRSLLLTPVALAFALALAAPPAQAGAPDYILLNRCTATMDERQPTRNFTWQLGIPLVAIQLANGTGGWKSRHTFEFDTYAFCNGPNEIPEYGTGDDVCLGRAADLPGQLVYSAVSQAPDALSGSFSLTDSPSGDYSANRNISAIIVQSFNLVGYTDISLVYFSHHALRWTSGGDQGIVEVSNNGGIFWTPVRTHQYYLGDKGQFKRVDIDLDTYAGQEILIRFRFVSNSSSNDDGWFIDDVRLLADGTTLFYDDFEAGTGNWALEPPWGLSLAGYNFSNLGTAGQNGVYTTIPVTNPVSTGEGMGWGALRASFTSGKITRTAHAQMHHTAPQYKAAPELGYDNLCPETGACQVTAVGGPERAPEVRVVLEQNRPNPFNPSTHIRFALPDAAPVSLRIVDEAGRVVRSLIAGEELPAGEHGTSWDGRDAGGQAVRSGVYFYELEVAGHAHTRKMLLLK